MRTSWPGGRSSRRRGDRAGDSSPAQPPAAGLSSTAEEAIRNSGTGADQKILKKVKRIKLGLRAYKMQMQMKLVLERDNWQRQQCRSMENLQIQLKIKRSQQGDDSSASFETPCAHCHVEENGQLGYSASAAGKYYQ